jgi:hypothetical protein
LKYPCAFDCDIVFESYGVRVKIEATGADLLKDAEQTARKALIGRLRILENTSAEHSFGFTSNKNGTLFMFQNGKQLTYGKSKTLFLKFFNSMLRIVVAEHAQSSVFVHAGVVSWEGKAIVIPANSFQGKTTLVAELVKAGAEYYSDEYAVLDEHGLVHPFPRDLSIRDKRFVENDVPVESLGGKIGSVPIPVGAVLLTEYREKAEWNPQRLTRGQGIMEVLPHTIPRNINTKFSLKVLNAALSDAIILKGPRGDAAELATKLLSLF